MLLMIDNYDSFTFNLVQYFRELGAEVRVVQNDQATVAELVALQPEHVVISPGPCTPAQAGISLEAISAFAGRAPVLGVCLGHQAIGQAFGGRVVPATAVMHGKVSSVYHKEDGVFRGLAQPFTATRYHSLVVDADSLPPCLQVTAWTQGDNNETLEIMGIRHREIPVEGVQFHPEAILSEYGHQLLRNFLEQ